MNDRKGKEYRCGQIVRVYGRKYGRFYDRTRYGIVRHGRKWEKNAKGQIDLSKPIKDPYTYALFENSCCTIGERDQIVGEITPEGVTGLYTRKKRNGISYNFRFYRIRLFNRIKFFLQEWFARLACCLNYL